MPSKLGILAGGGALPAMLVQDCIKEGRPFFVIAFEDQADRDLVAPKTVPHAWVRLGAAGKAIRILRRERVGELVMAGTIRRPSLAALRPDFWTMRFLARTGGLGHGDDAILTRLIGALQGEGFAITGIDALLPDLLAPEGVYGIVQPTDDDLADVECAIKAALDLGARDKGQAAVVRSGEVVALETAAGTDALLAGCAETAFSEPSGVLVKTSKPGQERRADLPTIGIGTVAGVQRAGLRGIAVEAGSALVVDRAAVAAAADRAGLFVMGVRTGEGR